YHGDEEAPERGVSKRAPTAVVTSYDREFADEIKRYHEDGTTRTSRA
nr:chromo domain-like [Tanacetum cinerariifolium]